MKTTTTMAKFKLTTNDILDLIGQEREELPKYCSQIINLANQNAQGTRPSVVGQMSDLVQEHGQGSLDEWRKWYMEDSGDKIDVATDRIYNMILNLREAIDKIDRSMVESWVRDLVINKTYAGINFQRAIMAHIADSKGVDYRLATPTEESLGIDGYIGDIAVSVKPSTYMSKDFLNEEIDAEMIYYTENGSVLTVEYDF